MGTREAKQIWFGSHFKSIGEEKMRTEGKEDMGKLPFLIPWAAELFICWERAINEDYMDG